MFSVGVSIRYGARGFGCTFYAFLARSWGFVIIDSTRRFAIITGVLSSGYCKESGVTIPITIVNVFLVEDGSSFGDSGLAQLI